MKKRFAISLRIVLLWLPLCVLLAAGKAEDLSANSSDAKRDEEYRRLVVGTWEDDYQGKRVMTVRPDGTATMVVKLSGLKAVLYASQLRFEMTWSIDQGRLKKHTTGGEPAGRVRMILNMMGDRVDEPILELTKDRLLLRDGDGKKTYNWRRINPVGAAETGSAKP